MKFSLIVPCYKCDKTIKKCLDSIFDQDEEDFEIICVINGQWDGRERAKKIINRFKDKRLRMIEIEEANACIARNKGAELSTGKYLSFFSSDFYMYPGALKKWEEAFEDSKADFVYCGYKLMDNGKFIDIYCPARQFDVYDLRSENYIDGGFPMKREVWEKGRWDKDIKSLNDWDFWLTAVDNGFRGWCMLDVTYAAEVPKAGGLSADSHANWIERTEQIKKKHNIPIRDICVVSLGAQPHGRRIAKLLNADFKVAPQMKPHKYKAIYLIGFYVGDGSSAVAHSQVFRNAPKDCKKIIHWIGTDVLQLVGAGYKVCYADMKMLVDTLDKMINLAEFDQTQGELLNMGIHSQIVPLPIEQNIEVVPLPKKFKVAIYAPRTPTAGHIYNLDFMRDIIKSCPDMDFVLFGGGLSEVKAKNVENLGWCDMKDVIEKTSCLLRYTAHDGLPVAPIEFRLAGRDAITTVSMPHIYFAGNGVVHEQNYAEKKEALIKTLRDVRADQKKHGVKDIEKARAYYLELTDPKKFKENIEKIICPS